MNYTLHKTFWLAERMWIKWFQQVDKKLTLSTWDYWQGDTSFPMLVVFGRGGSIQPDPFCYTRLLSCCCWRRWWLHLYWLQDSIAWRDDDNQVQRHVCVCENTWNISGKTSLRITRFLLGFTQITSPPEEIANTRITEFIRRQKKRGWSGGAVTMKDG